MIPCRIGVLPQVGAPHASPTRSDPPLHSSIGGEGGPDIGVRAPRLYVDLCPPWWHVK